jgi:hypothetical protein
VAYVTYRQGSAFTDVLVARSRDGGRTWSAPVRVPGAPQQTGAVYFQPQTTVDGSGQVGVSFFALAGGHVAVLLARSLDGGASFAPAMAVTSRPFDPLLGMRGGGTSVKDSLWWIGDYQGLAAGPHVMYPFWNDTRTGRLEIFTTAVPSLGQG